MGQEASIPRNLPDEAAACHQEPPLPPQTAAAEQLPQPGMADNAVTNVKVQSSGAQNAPTDGNPSLLNLTASHATLPSSVIHMERPQSQKQLRQQPQQPLPQHPTAVHAIGGKTTIFPSRYNQNAIPPQPLPLQQGGSTPATTSIMSRAGLSSMIQRMGGVGSAGSSRSVPNSPSRYGSRNSGSSHGAAKQNTSQNLHHRQQQQQNAHQHEHKSNNSIHHQELSPDSKARQQATMMRKQQQEQQRLQQQKNTRVSLETHQLSSSSNSAIDDDGGSSKSLVNTMYAEGHNSTSSKPVTVTASEFLGENSDANSGEGAATLLAQGMTNLQLSLSRSQPRPLTQQNDKSPPSPRAISLRQMQHNDEEDWEKAWAEDSEDSDEDDEVMADADMSNKITGAGVATITGSELDDSNLPIVPDFSVGDAKLRVEVNESTGAFRTSDVDSGDSNVPLAHGIVEPKTLEMQSAFTPIQPQHLLGNIQQRDKIPLIHHPPLKNEVDDKARFMLEANETLKQGAEYVQQRNWDLCNREGALVEEEDERPCVKMFDPALRVLGRGSFGRVSDPAYYSA